MKSIDVPAAAGFGELEKFAKLDVDQVCWPADYPYKPEVKVALAHTADRLLIRFDVCEQNVKAVTTLDNGPVWEDSCAEFFVKVPGSAFYFNFETNCIGTGLAAKRVSKTDCVHFTPGQMARVLRRSSLPHEPVDIKDGAWSLELEVPFDLIDCEGCPEKLLVNFYKCGDNTAVPHFVSWNLVGSETPNFHLPEYFGELRLL